MTIAWRLWARNTIFYVANLPGDNGVDWGYHTDPRKAIGLNKYWQRRFAANCRRCGSEARFYERGKV